MLLVQRSTRVDNGHRVQGISSDVKHEHCGDVPIGGGQQREDVAMPLKGIASAKTLRLQNRHTRLLGRESTLADPGTKMV